MRDGGALPTLKDLLLRRCDGLQVIEGNLAAAGPDGSKALMVVSARAGEGRTIAAAALGWALSASGRTLLVDADLRNRGLGRLFGVSANPGLVNVVLDGVEVEDVVRLTETGTLDILPGGRDAVEDADAMGPGVLRGEPFARLVAALRGRWRYVVFDTPPLLDSAQAALMARHVDGSVLVLDAGRTRWDTARMATDGLYGVGGRLVGAVLNRRRSYVPRAFS